MTAPIKVSAFAVGVACCAATALVFAACNADEVAKQCVAADLIGQCPVGSNPVLGAAANDGCGGSFDGQFVEENASVTGQCSSSGTCEFLCQFAVPCTCGVATITKEEIVCSVCPDQTCGDSKCEGTERGSCGDDAGPGCFACPEDCDGPSCGDDVCSGLENPQNCPQDCARLCEPSAKDCLGTIARTCQANGAAYDTFDCATVALTCGGGECVAPNVCGNHVCEAGESPATCVDCVTTACTPNESRCTGATLHTCSADGSDEAETDCAASGMVCAAGACKPAGVCGNQLCESGETPEGCPDDCAAECGNHVCENGETNSCPSDCVVCGDHVCGAGELESCPQDCGICIPSAHECLGKKLRVCNANGTAFDDVDCGAFDQICAGGDCVDPNVCGNGACEASEDQAGCPSDCAVVCGDHQCEGAETFDTCSIDCEPLCGDGKCQGDETRAGCPDDCLATCGNHACDALEDRDNCPGDCGFCGDTRCDDGFESARSSPPAGQITCLVDCVVSGCQADGDCSDGISCTPGRCIDHVCAYTADDALCPHDQKCIKFNGCCADADHDGFADAACGGSDCDDGDPLTYPGAVEVCGGGDRNCNGVHRPSLGPAKKVTATAAYKSGLVMTWDGARFWAAWLGVPESTNELQYARVGKDGNLIGPVAHLAGVTPNDMPFAIAWNPAVGHLGIGYAIANIARFATVDATGAATADVYPDLADTAGNQRALDIRMGVLDGHYIVSTYGNTNCGPAGNTQCDIGWYDVTEEQSVSRPWGTVPAAQDFVAIGDQLVAYSSYGGPNTGAGGYLHKVRLGEDSYVQVDIAPAAADGKCALDYDGETLVLVCQYQASVGNQPDGGRVYYLRLAGNGAALSSTIVEGVTTAAPRDIAIAPDGLKGNDTPKIGVVSQEANGNLVFFVRDLDGSAVVEPGVIAGGATVKDPHVFWDGDGFQVFWLEKSGDLEQLFRSQVTCE